MMVPSELKKLRRAMREIIESSSLAGLASSQPRCHLPGSDCLGSVPSATNPKFAQGSKGCQGPSPNPSFAC